MTHPLYVPPSPTLHELHAQGQWATLLNRIAPGLIIAAIFALAVAIFIGEWRDGTLGVQRAVDSRIVVFEPQPDGTLAVTLVTQSGDANRVLLPSASEGFVATLSRSLARERRRFDVAESEPYRLTRFENGTVALTDPVLGTDIRLEAFGRTNAGAFVELMTRRPAP